MRNYLCGSTIEEIFFWFEHIPIFFLQMERRFENFELFLDINIYFGEYHVMLCRYCLNNKKKWFYSLNMLSIKLNIIHKFISTSIARVLLNFIDRSKLFLSTIDLYRNIIQKFTNTVSIKLKILKINASYFLVSSR